MRRDTTPTVSDPHFLQRIKYILITILQIVNGIFLISASVYLAYTIFVGDLCRSILIILSVALMTYLAERL